MSDPPTFDSLRFASWLKKWKSSERLEWAQVADRGGMSLGAVQQLARGTPGKVDRDRGQTTINPSITTIARLAHGLGLDLEYVLSKAGLPSSRSAGRWAAFTPRARQHLLIALTMAADSSGELRRLRDDLAEYEEKS